MKLSKGISIMVLYLLIWQFNAHAQVSQSIYYKVAIKLENDNSLRDLFLKGIPVDHSTINETGEVEVVVSDHELDILKSNGLNHRIIIENLAAYNEERLSMDDSWKRTLSGGACDLENYTTGSMGGYHVADEVFENLDKMRSKFPALISAKESIGKTVEGKDIYMVKISDNPDKDEEEAVAYFDGLTHAREPMGMEVLLHYMWWLLENYEKDPAVKYLVDNREIYFVPLVNVDGYKYNQQTNSNGGGMHRKNRRNNNCNNQGIDLNRNFNADWGVVSSTDPCSDTYRGPSAASEPETKAIQELLDKIKPLSGFSNHAHGHMMLSPKGSGIVIPQHDLFSEFAMELTPEKFIGHGTPKLIIGYEGTGATLDYITGPVGAIGWTPEIGKSGAFWPSQSEICPLNKEMLPALYFVSWIAGDFAGLNSYSFQNSDGLIPNGTAELIIRVKNKGLSTTSKDVKVEISSTNPNVEIRKSSVEYGDIEKRAFADNEKEPFEVYIGKDATPGDDVKLTVKVWQNGAVSYEKELLLTVGKPNVLFYDGAENGKTNWQGNGWDVTENHDFGGTKCFTDSKTKNYTANGSSTFELSQGVDISAAKKPFLEYAAKWTLEGNSDYVKVEVNSGGSWVALKGLHTRPVSGGEGYTTHSHWVQEKMDLSSHKGANVKVRFSFKSNGSVHSDGFYFDEFRIVDYLDDVASGISNLQKELNFTMFPNPNEGKFQVLIESNNNIGKVNLSATNIYGQKVFEEELGQISNKVVHNLDLSKLAKGVYFMKLSNGVVGSSKRIVIK